MTKICVTDLADIIIIILAWRLFLKLSEVIPSSTMPVSSGGCCLSVPELLFLQVTTSINQGSSESNNVKKGSVSATYWCDDILVPS